MGPAEKIRKFTKALVTRTLEFEFERMPYKLREVSTGKLLTLFRSELNCLHSSPGQPWYPAQLQIEASAACTLQCPLCPAGIDAIDKPRSMMKMDTFRSLIDEVGDHSVIAIFWMWGEPFTNSQFCDMVSYAHRKNLATVTSTNGQHIQTREDAERLVSSGLDNLIVAMDGSTQEIYSKYRIGGDLQRILRCLELIAQAKKTLCIDKPRVNVRTVVMKHNEHELPEIEKIAMRYGANMVSRKTVSLPDYCDADDERFAPSDAKYRRYQYKNGRRIHLSGDEFRCRRPWNRLSITADGTVLSCEFDFNSLAPFGHAGDGKSFMQIWQGKDAASFRRQFLKNRRVYKFCAECNFRDRGDNECTVELRHLVHQPSLQV